MLHRANSQHGDPRARPSAQAIRSVLVNLGWAMLVGCLNGQAPSFSDAAAICMVGGTPACPCPDGSEGQSRCTGGVDGPCADCTPPKGTHEIAAAASEDGGAGKRVDDTIPDPSLSAGRAATVSATTTMSQAQLGGRDGGSAEPLTVMRPNVDDIECNEADGQAYLTGTYRCDDAPAYVTLSGTGGVFDIFTYEASHPLASATQAHPCASLGPVQGPRVHLRAPQEPTEACSRPAVRPWYTVTWQQASDACAFIGWRLCRRDEFLRACGGLDARAYPYGPVFRNGVCNVRDLYRVDGSALSSEAPTGHYEDCRSADGLYDMTGNLWEWIDERIPGSPGIRMFMGMGYRTVAERHQDAEMRCDTDSRLPASVSANYVNQTVGFRCCRDAD
ncbi:MAG: SUMF1/EgtB/PvdO family nonheme iron enzyme [Myxococcota bacterium]|nr:SUMF1/EgtB/PvdO family nonheme iron enzyme [Myxococcota bacterium]